MFEKSKTGMHIYNNCLVITIQTELDDNVLLDLQKEILDKAENTSIKGVILDVSYVNIIDAFMFEIIINTAQMIKLLGKEMVISGMKPEVAGSLSNFDFDINKIKLANCVEHGYEVLNSTKSNVEKGN